MSYRLVEPFIIPVLTSFIIALLIYPVYKWLRKIIRSNFLCSLAVVVLFLIVIAVPFGYVINVAAKEAYSAYIEGKKLVVGDDFLTECTDGTICELTRRANEYFQEPQTKYYIEQLGEAASKYLLEYGSSFLLRIPGRILDLFIFIFFLFYLLKDGDKIVASIKTLLPLDEKSKNQLTEKTRKGLYAVLYGQFLTALIQGFTGALGFFVLGLSSPIFWGLVMAFFSILPVGTPFIWGPVAGYLIISGYALGDTILITKGLILLAYGLLVISSIDNVVRPKLIGDKLKAHPLLVLIGILGGLFVFGFVGIFIGPLILILLLAIIDLYRGVKE
ncbi:AI-2E family transporter [Candidatus Woesearchaeota archaeon]|nr:AI-2E family transporter [Candidatus Woesearchaeota archaeon]